LVIIDGAIDHVCLLLLKQDHSRFDGIFDAKAGDDAGTALTDAMATVGRLPFSSGVPPPVKFPVSIQTAGEMKIGNATLTDQ